MPWLPHRQHYIGSKGMDPSRSRVDGADWKLILTQNGVKS